MRDPWNMAANLWHRARHAPASRKRVVPKPIVSTPLADHYVRPLMKGRELVTQDGEFIDCVCRDCGCTNCGCEQRWEARQEAQRAALAPSPEELQRQGYAPQPRLRTREEIDRALNEHEAKLPKQIALRLEADRMQQAARQQALDDHRARTAPLLVEQVWKLMGPARDALEYPTSNPLIVEQVWKLMGPG